MKDRALKATIAGIGIVGTYIAAESLKACRSVIGNRCCIKPDDVIEAINNQNSGT
jgi:hypothetical protein